MVTLWLGSQARLLPVEEPLEVVIAEEIGMLDCAGAFGSVVVRLRLRWMWMMRGLAE